MGIVLFFCLSQNHRRAMHARATCKARGAKIENSGGNFRWTRGRESCFLCEGVDQTGTGDPQFDGDDSYKQMRSEAAIEARSKLFLMSLSRRANH